tara:strand:- start:1425 stop:2450 length:1026 start_codon:yes stop_codon:yes gene_type:complete
MKRVFTLIPIVALAISLSVACAQPEPVEAPAESSDVTQQEDGTVRVFDVPIDHVAVVVHDIEKSSEAYADILQLPVPEINEHPDGIEFASDYTGNRDATVKTATFPLNGVTMELVQPVGGPSPWSDHLDQYGESLHHIGLNDVKDVAGSAALAVSMGGKLVVGGGPGATSAAIDMRSVFGFTLSLSELPGTRRTISDDEASSKFSDNKVQFISMIVPDIEKSAGAFAELLGVPMPNISDPQITYPPEFTGNRDAHPRLAMFPLSGITVAYTSPVDGPSPWSENVEKFGPAMHHLGIQVNGFKDTIEYFEERGGSLVIGGADLGYCWVDVPQLSTVFELYGQ